MLKIQNKKMLSTIALSIVAVIFLVAGLALAQGNGQKSMRGMRGHGQGMACEEGHGMNRLDRMAKHLELSDEQKEAIEQLQEKNRADNLDLHKDVMRLQNEMQGEMMKDEPSEKSVLKINAEISALKGELRANRLKTRLAVREQLTSEQRDKMMVQGHGGPGKGKGRGKKGGFHGKSGRHGKAGCDGCQ